MISLSNLFFDEHALHKRIVKCNDHLSSLREAFIETFFKDMDKRNPSLPELANRLNAYPFTEFPVLRAQYLYLFSLRTHLPTIVFDDPHQAYALFHKMNQHFGYFTSHERELGYLFHRLLNACRKLILLHEKTDPQEVPWYAYKIMTVFCETESHHTLRFSFIANQMLQFLSGCASNTPYHDAWLTMLDELPVRDEINDFAGWRQLFKQYRMASLSYFADAKNIETLNGGSAPKSLALAQALLEKHKYKRASEDPVFAEICRKKVISEEVFEKGLNFIQRGWPRKMTDDLPDVRVDLNDGQYVWLKLPPQDKRALILGRYVPGCCQIIGGAAGFCVEQGISLPSSGFYVLLKQKNGVESAEPIIGDEINELHFEVVAQSYVWISRDDNLCLDSIERDSSKVSNDTIKLIMQGFSEAVYDCSPNIKHIHVGQGGQTPTNLFPVALRTEKIKQGRQYSDSIDQYCVAHQMPSVLRDQMQHLLSSHPATMQEMVKYVIPYFSLEEQYMVPNHMGLLIKQIKPHKLNYILRKNSLSWSDFTTITLDTYEQRSAQEQMSITTLQKLLNAETDEMALAWMTTIPVYEYEDIFDFKRLKKNSYWFRFAKCKNVHLLTDVVSRLESASRHHFLETTALFSVENMLSHLRDSKHYGILIKLIGLCIPEERFTLFKRYLNGVYAADFFVDKNIEYILEVVGMVPDAERVKLLKYFMQVGCLSQTMNYFFEKVSKQLSFEQFMDFMTFKLSYLKNKPVWRICYKYWEVFQQVLSVYSESQRNMFFEEIGIFNLLIRHEKYHHFARLLSILGVSQQVEYIWNQKYLFYFIQGGLFEELQTLVSHFPEDIQVEFQHARPIFLQIHMMLLLIKPLCIDFKTSIQSTFENLWKQYHHHRIDKSELLQHVTVLFQQKLNGQRGAALSKNSLFQDQQRCNAGLQDLEDCLKKQLGEQNMSPIKSERK